MICRWFCILINISLFIFLHFSPCNKFVCRFSYFSQSSEM